MPYMKALIGGLIGAVVGAAVWAAIAHFANYELGLIAWGLGILVGIGVHVGSADEADATTGALAVLIALLGLLGGKWAAVSLSVQSASIAAAIAESMDEPLDRETTISYLADEVVYERQQQGRRVTWPRGVDPDDAAAESDYPADIWSEAERRYDALDPDEQSELRQDPWLANPDYIVSWLADDIAADLEASGKILDWPPLPESGVCDREEHYPADLWREARLGWEGMSKVERQDYKEDVRRRQTQALQDGIGAATQEIRWQAFLASFSLFDLLWFGLAVASAWKLGSGGFDGA